MEEIKASMIDINKFIEEEALKYDKSIGEWIGREDAFIAGGRFVLTHLQCQNRWRKVEDEEPEVLTDVLIKDSFGKVDIGCLYDNGIWGMTPPIDRKITEWKPIE